MTAASYNELMGLGSHSEDASAGVHMPLQDDAASTNVVDEFSGASDGTLNGGSNTADLSTTGPNSYLAKAMGFDGASYVSVPAGDWLPSGSYGYTVMYWVDIVTAKPTDQHHVVEFNATDSSRIDSKHGNGALHDQITSRMYRSGGAQDSASTVTVDSLLGWRLVSVIVDNSNHDLYVDTDSNLATPGDTSLTTATKKNIGADESNINFSSESIAGVVTFRRALATSEKDEYAGGPEPIYSSGASFGSDGSFDVGTWGLDAPFSSGSNGTITYEVVAVKADGTLLDSAATSTGTLDLSGNAGNTCYLLVRATNDGGYDTGDFSSRTSGYGSADDGYFEIASVVAAGGSTSIAPADCTHGQTATSPTLSQVHAISPDDCTHGQTCESAALTQTHQIAPADCNHAQTAESPALSQVHQISAADCLHAQTVESPSLAVGAQIAPQDCTHGQTCESPLLSQLHQIVAESCVHDHSCDNATVTLATVGEASDGWTFASAGRSWRPRSAGRLWQPPSAGRVWA